MQTSRFLSFQAGRKYSIICEGGTETNPRFSVTDDDGI